MRLPIALGLSAPVRLDDVARGCDWTKAAEWTFEPLDNDAFPAVNLARQCLKASEKHTTVLNAANEQAVHAFLDGRLAYLDIVPSVAETIEQMDAQMSANPLFESVAEVEELEREARARQRDHRRQGIVFRHPRRQQSAYIRHSTPDTEHAGPGAGMPCSTAERVPEQV